MKTEHKVMRILEQAYADKTNCFPKTRYRAITWGGPPCYWLQFPNWLYNCWGILMIAGMDLFSGNVIMTRPMRKPSSMASPATTRPASCAAT